MVCSIGGSFVDHCLARAPGLPPQVTRAVHLAHSSTRRSASLETAPASHQRQDKAVKFSLKQRKPGPAYSSPDAHLYVEKGSDSGSSPQQQPVQLKAISPRQTVYLGAFRSSAEKCLRAADGYQPASAPQQRSPEPAPQAYPGVRPWMANTLLPDGGNNNEILLDRVLDRDQHAPQQYDLMLSARVQMALQCASAAEVPQSQQAYAAAAAAEQHATGHGAFRSPVVRGLQAAGGNSFQSPGAAVHTQGELAHRPLPQTSPAHQPGARPDSSHVGWSSGASWQSNPFLGSPHTDLDPDQDPELLWMQHHVQMQVPRSPLLSSGMRHGPVGHAAGGSMGMGTAIHRHLHSALAPSQHEAEDHLSNTEGQGVWAEGLGVSSGSSRPRATRQLFTPQQPDLATEGEGGAALTVQHMEGGSGFENVHLLLSSIVMPGQSSGAQIGPSTPASPGAAGSPWRQVSTGPSVNNDGSDDSATRLLATARQLIRQAPGGPSPSAFHSSLPPPHEQQQSWPPAGSLTTPGQVTSGIVSSNDPSAELAVRPTLEQSFWLLGIEGSRCGGSVNGGGSSVAAEHAAGTFVAEQLPLPESLYRQPIRLVQLRAVHAVLQAKRDVLTLEQQEQVTGAGLGDACVWWGWLMHVSMCVVGLGGACVWRGWVMHVWWGWVMHVCGGARWCMCVNACR